ncbi:nuclear transport factor 2 family protein [Promicromonospora sp. Populi]|uniref:nuclear transport factor 2 family protein n=1 Tax=Promicromonospora sp. Populi TaxID=3239420 RepID=UPI0034E1D2E2
MSEEKSLTEQHRAIVEDLYAAANRGDLEGAFANLAEDFILDEPTFLPFGKVYHGLGEFRDLAPVLSNYLAVDEIVVHYTIADGDRVAAIVGIPDRATGKLTHLIELYTFKDGKIVQNQLFYHDAGTLTDLPKVV